MDNKILNLILKRLSKWKIGTKAPPVTMLLHLTNRCNFKCIYCDGGFTLREPLYSNPPELTTRKWVSIAKEAVEFGVKEWEISGGGDPLVRAETVASMISTIKRMDPDSLIEVSTNGWFLTKRIAKKIVRFNCDTLQVGIDAPNVKIHDFLKGKKGSFLRITKNIRFLSSLKEKLKKDKPRIVVSTVLTSKNYNKLPEIAMLAHFLGANTFVVVPMRIDSGNYSYIKKAKLELTTTQIKIAYKIWEKVEEIGKKYKIDVSEFYRGDYSKSNQLEQMESRKLNLLLSAFCLAPFYSILVNEVGNVGPCMAANPRNIGCNLATKSLKEIWYSKFFQSVRKAMLERKPEKSFDFLPCKYCNMNVQLQQKLTNTFNLQRK